MGNNPLNVLGQTCLASWQKYLPGWRIQKWDESNSPMSHPYVEKMMKEGKYAFASDYVRLHALADQGGLYMDTDMELISDVESILKHPCVLAFLSAQNRPSKNSAALGLLASVPNHSWILELRDRYQGMRKAVMNTTLATESLKRRGLGKLRRDRADQEFWDLENIRIYHADFFYLPENGNPVHKPLAIHHAVANWGGPADPLPWWRKLYDLRLDRKLLRPVEAMVRKIRKPAGRIP